MLLEVALPHLLFSSGKWRHAVSGGEASRYYDDASPGEEYHCSWASILGGWPDESNFHYNFNCKYHEAAYLPNILGTNMHTDSSFWADWCPWCSNALHGWNSRWRMAILHWWKHARPVGQMHNIDKRWQYNWCEIYSGRRCELWIKWHLKLKESNRPRSAGTHRQVKHCTLGEEICLIKLCYE